jgi:hypothetical protein
MTRNLKALGLILAAALTMCAALASGAQAKPIVTAAKYPVILTGDQVKHKEFQWNTFTLNEKKLFCKGATFSATIKSQEEANKGEITVTPGYSECFANPGEIPMTVNPTGCDYLFHGGEEDVANHFKRGEVDLKCPEGVTGVDINVYASAAKHAANEPLCSYAVTPANNLGGKENNEITYTNTAGTPNDFDITVKSVQVPLERTFGGKVLCGEPNQTSIYEGEITVTGFEDLSGTEGARVGVTVSNK